jgi:hypothetical protein
MVKKKRPDYRVAGHLIARISGASGFLLSAEGWSDTGNPVLLLDNSTVLYPSSDAEGNEAGALFGEDAEGAFHVVPGPHGMFLWGRMIRSVRRMTAAEIVKNAWGGLGEWQIPAVLVLDNGILYPSRDPEGNGPGVIFARTKAGEFFIVEPEGPKEWTPRS